MLNFFNGMYKDGLIKADPLLDPAYNKAVNDGAMLSWPSAVWAPGVIYGVAPKTAGKWRLADLPRWNANDPTVSFQGGSSVAVISGSKHPKQAAEFAKWQNATEAGAKMILNDANGYPAALSGEAAAIQQQPPKLMPQQSDYYQVVANIAKNTRAITWGPDTDVAKAAFTDAMNAAVQTASRGWTCSPQPRRPSSRTCGRRGTRSPWPTIDPGRDIRHSTIRKDERHDPGTPSADKDAPS